MNAPQNEIKQEIIENGIDMFMEFKELSDFGKIEIGMLVYTDIKLGHGEVLDPIPAVVENFDKGKTEVLLRISREHGAMLRRKSTSLEKITEKQKMLMLKDTSRKSD